MEDLYKIFGVLKIVFQDEICKVYCKLVKELYFDVNLGDKVVEECFKNVLVVFNLLFDVEKWVEYDVVVLVGFGFQFFSGGMGGVCQCGLFNFQKGCQGGRGFDDIGDIFLDLFMDFGVGGVEQVQFCCKGEDICQFLKLDFMQVVEGGKYCVVLLGGWLVDVVVLAGVSEGQVLCLCGQGYFLVNGGGYGDVLVEICICEYKYFLCDGDNVQLDLFIMFKEVVFGVKVWVFIIDGDVDVCILFGLNSGGLLCLCGKGFVSVKGVCGDQIIWLMIVLLECDQVLQDFLEVWSLVNGYDLCKGLKF